ncbi:MAG: hypothetical protein ABW065_02305 [Solirubrobacterales bacterium]
MAAGSLRGARVYIVGLAAALVLAIAPSQAQAASPVLEFVTPFPTEFTADGGAVTAAMADFKPVVHCADSEGAGEITGPRSTDSIWLFTGCEAKGGDEDGHLCQSESLEPGEIEPGEIYAGPMEADLVFIDQASHSVGMLLNPGGGEYMDFECGGEPVEAFGSFLSPVGPINTVTSSFTASLSRSGATQIPSEYESASGEKLKAIPMGKRASAPAATTGVELGFNVLTSTPLEIRALSAADVEAREREAKQREEEAAAKKRQEDEAAAKKRQEEEAAKKRQEEELLAQKPPTRAQLLAKALKRCRSFESKAKRSRCVSRARNKYGNHKGHKKQKA